MEYQFLIVTFCVSAALALLSPSFLEKMENRERNQQLNNISSQTPFQCRNLSESANAIAQSYVDAFNLSFPSDNEREIAMTNLAKAHELVQCCQSDYEKKQSNFLLTVYPFNVLTPEQIIKSRAGSEPKDLDISTLRKRRSMPQSKLNNVCANLPESKNWAAEGVVLPPQNQGDCCNCYIFSAVSALESAIALKYGASPVKLSEQQLTDCVRDPAQPSKLGGCNRGRVEWAWNLTKSYNGAVEYDDYRPYTATDDGGCNATLPKMPNSEIDSWLFTRYADEEALKCSLVRYGPHHISMDFSGNISNYKSGIFDDPMSNCNTTVIKGKMVKPYNHALTLVGYGSELNNAGVMMDYWLVKNSFGPDWGMNGYIKVARNKNNLCHIATDAAVPILSYKTATTTTKSTTQQETSRSTSTSSTSMAANTESSIKSTLGSYDTTTSSTSDFLSYQATSTISNFIKISIGESNLSEMQPIGEATPFDSGSTLSDVTTKKSKHRLKCVPVKAS